MESFFQPLRKKKFSNPLCKSNSGNSSNRSVLERKKEKSEDEIVDSCLVKENGRLEDVAKRLWSKAIAFGVSGGEANNGFIDAIKQLELRDGFLAEQKMESKWGQIMNVVSLNMRGCGKLLKRKQFNRFIKKERFNFCLLQETKIQFFQDSWVFEL